MAIYIIFFIVFAILSVEFQLFPFKKEPILVIIVIFLSLMAGFRGYGIDKDYINYQNNFDLIYDNIGRNDGVFLPIFEPAYMGIVVVARTLFLNNYGAAIMIFFAFSSVILKINSFNKLCPNPFLVILFYFSQYFLLHEMTQIRIGLASGIFFISLSYYFTGRKALFIFCILLATLFHYSAIFYLIVLFFKDVSFNKIWYCSLLLLAILFSFIKLPFLQIFSIFDPSTVSGRLTNYATLTDRGIDTEINIFNVVSILNYLTCFYYIFFIPKEIFIKDKLLVFFIKCNILSLLVLPIFMTIPSMAFRFSELYGVGSMFLFSFLLYYLPFKKVNFIIVISLAALLLYINIFHDNLLKEYFIIKIK